MPPRSAVTQLPEDVKAELDTRLLSGGFAGYAGLAEWLGEQGFTISKSALHRYGSAFEEKTEKLRVATQMSITLAEAAGDDAGAMNDALIRLAQGELFDILLEADKKEKPIAAILPEITLSVARLTRASVQQKKWQTEFRDKLKKTADKVAGTARKGGLSPDAVENIKRDILGVVG